jgi:hypothetical protein
VCFIDDSLCDNDTWILVCSGIAEDEERCYVLFENNNPLMANGIVLQIMQPLVTIIDDRFRI